MFRLLKRKFYSVIAVVAVLLAIVLVSAYYVIDKALVSDYLTKTTDIAHKITNDLQIKTDYMQYISLLFIDNLLKKTDNNGNFADYDFNADVSKIKMYNNDIDGLGIFWDNGKRSSSSSIYLQYIPELTEIIKNENKTCWAIVKEKNNDKGLLFLLTPIRNEKTSQSGFALVDATTLKKNFTTDSIFLQDASAYFSVRDKTLYMIGEDAKSKKQKSAHNKNDLVIRETVSDELELVLNFPMSEVRKQLNNVKLYMILFGVCCIVLTIIVVYKMVKKIVTELESLKDEIDTYAMKK